MIDADGRGIDAALDRAYLRALEVGRRTNTPVWIMVDGKLVDALAEERAATNGKHVNGKSEGSSK